MKRYVLALLVVIASNGCSPEKPGPFERAGESVDATVTTVGDTSVEIAQKTKEGALHVTNKVGEALEKAGEWVQRKTEASTPTPTETPQY